MDKFVLDMRGMRRENPFSMPVSYIGYIPDELSRPKPTIHPTIDICLVLSGESQKQAYMIDGRPSPSTAVPFFVFKRPGLLYEPLQTTPVRREILYFSYGTEFLNRFEFFCGSLDNHLFGIDSARLAPFVTGIIELCRDVHKFGNVDRIDRACESLINELIVFKKCETSIEDSERTQGVRSIASYIAMHFREPIELNAILRRHGLSKRTFLRRWAELFGESPRSYMAQLKVNEACRLLCEPGISIGEVATKTGFEDPYYFSRFFRKHMGVSPKAYVMKSRTLNITA